jgi:hypothetical protein
MQVGKHLLGMGGAAWKHKKAESSSGNKFPGNSAFSSQKVLTGRF